MVLNLTGQEYIRTGHLGAALPDDNVLVGFLMHRTSFADPFLLQQGNDGSRNTARETHSTMNKKVKNGQEPRSLPCQVPLCQPRPTADAVIFPGLTLDF